ncbi:MAG: PIN domain-containing protein [Nitrospira sp.]|nr:PIN domain-containing protein [Nitrospira sp.]
MVVNLVVDTSVWSLILRRPRVDETHPLVRAFRAHVAADDGIFLVGNILQELLDGLRDKKNFDRLKRLLEPFPLVPLERDTYIEAAVLRQRCRTKGVQASAVDCLIAAACIQHGFPLLTADRDFSYIAKHSELALLTPQG